MTPARPSAPSRLALMVVGGVLLAFYRKARRIDDADESVASDLGAYADLDRIRAETDRLMAEGRRANRVYLVWAAVCVLVMVGVWALRFL